MDFAAELPSQNAELSLNWAHDMVNIGALRDFGFTGKDTSIAIVDADILSPRPAQVILGRDVPRRDAHGSLIRDFIKYHLPHARVDLIRSADSEEMCSAIREVGRQQFDVVNLSMGTFDPRTATHANEAFADMVQIAVRGKAGTFSEVSEKYQASLKSAKSSELLAQEMQYLVSRGVIPVAATGYGYTRFTDTFGIFPNVLMIGGLHRNMVPIDSPDNGRIDFFAPGEDIQISHDGIRI